MKTRTFAQIIQDEQNKRNILEIQLNKIVTNNTDPKSLTYEDTGELLFDVLEINLMIAFHLTSTLVGMTKEK